MKKSTRIVKRALALFLIVLMSIESFGAVVSDNDGSAFITKAEFDSMKNDFQSQIDQYNTSIDSKIDGAIAAYLAGIKTANSVQYYLVYSGENTHFMNGVIAPTFRVPEMHYVIQIGHTNLAENCKNVTCAMSLNYPADWGTSEIALKPLIKLVEDEAVNSEADIRKIYWDGCALRYREILSIGRIEAANNSLGYYDEYVDHRVLASNVFAFNNVGYKNDIKSAQLVASSLNCQYKKGSSGWVSYLPTSYRWAANSNSLAAVLDTYNNKTKDHLHICNYDNKSWELYNEQFVNTLSLSSQQTITETSLYNVVNSTSYLNNWGTWCGTDKTNFAYGTLSMTFITGTTKIPSVGKLVSNYNSDAIYQFNKDKKINFRNEWTIGNPNILAGMPSFGAEAEDKVTWDVYFPTLKCYTSDTNYETNPSNVEVRIYVATTPFTDGINIDTTKGKKIKFKVGNIEQEYIDTKDRKARLTWIMDESSFIYIKCIPVWGGTSYIDKDWDIEMDLNGDYSIVHLDESR